MLLKSATLIWAPHVESQRNYASYAMCFPLHKFVHIGFNCLWSVPYDCFQPERRQFVLRKGWKLSWFSSDHLKVHPIFTFGWLRKFTTLHLAPNERAPTFTRFPLCLRFTCATNCPAVSKHMLHVCCFCFENLMKNKIAKMMPECLR